MLSLHIDSCKGEEEECCPYNYYTSPPCWLLNKMADNTIKVTVLEGVSASLSALGLPLPVCLQLQLSGLKLSEAMWTAKSSSAGFSVSLFWPSLEQQVGGVVTAIPKRKKRRRRHKTKTCTTPGSPVAHLLAAAEVCESKVPQDPTPISALHHDKSSGNWQKAESGSGDVVAVDETDDEQWTRVERMPEKEEEKASPTEDSQTQVPS